MIDQLPLWHEHKRERIVMKHGEVWYMCTTCGRMLEVKDA